MTWIVLAYHLASRLAYVLYVGLTLNRPDRTQGGRAVPLAQESHVYRGLSAGLRLGAGDRLAGWARRRAVRPGRHPHLLSPGREAAFRAGQPGTVRARRQACTWFRPPSFARYSARSAALTT